MQIQDYYMGLSRYPENWLVQSNHLAGIYPWYDTSVQENFFTLDYSELFALRKIKEIKSVVDLPSIVNRIYLPYLIGNRTLINDIERAPWMSYPKNGQWIVQQLPAHGRDKPDPRKFVSELKSALVEEIFAYINGKTNIGILLSGGMDSRILAAVLREFQNTVDPKIIVTGITWGDPNARDVVYAQRIALQFDWEWQHIGLSAETLHQNIIISASNGSEVSPIHYHGMDEVSKIKGLDLILAGSYGDSVGRGEYSGTHVSKLTDISFKGKDLFGLIKNKAKEYFIPILEQNLFSPTNTVNALRRREIQQQQHYLRRMLQACMMHISKRTPFNQIFTAPEVFGKMWSLDPSIRDDRWYILLLKELPGNLLNIPWARTGLPFGQSNGNIDRYTKSYHSYGMWLRTDLKNDVIDAVNSSTIRDLGIFNDNSLDQAVSLWGKATTRSINYFDEIFSWMVSLKIFLERNNIEKSDIEFKAQFQDRLSTYKGRIYGEFYIRARNNKRT